MDKELIKAIKNISTGIDKMEKVLTRQLKDINKNIQRKDTVKKELVYRKEDAIEFILKDLDVKQVDRTVIGAVLNAEERYMRSVGIIEE